MSITFFHFFVLLFDIKNKKVIPLTASFETKNLNTYKVFRFFRARDGTRTRDPNLGKVVLHQLSHSRIFSLFSSSFQKNEAGSPFSVFPSPPCTLKITYWIRFPPVLLFPYLSGQALDRLVTVSSIRYRTSTSALSTSFSSRGLTAFAWDISS